MPLHSLPSSNSVIVLLHLVGMRLRLQVVIGNHELDITLSCGYWTYGFGGMRGWKSNREVQAATAK